MGTWCRGEGESPVKYDPVRVPTVELMVSPLQLLIQDTRENVEQR